MVEQVQLSSYNKPQSFNNDNEYIHELEMNEFDALQPEGQLNSLNEEKLDPSLVWWKNSPFLYNSLLLHKLEWPSLTVSMINTNFNNKPKNSHISGWFTQKLILGTCTSGQEINYLIVGEVKFPISLNFKEDPLKCENHSSFLTPKTRARQGCSTPQSIPNLEIKGKIVHLGDVNRAVAMPQNDFLISTQAENGKILFFNYSKHPSVPSNLNICQPQLVLDAHKEEGFGLNWNPREYGQLASCSSDGSIAIWDISQQRSSNHIPAGHKLFNNSTSNDPSVVKLKEFTPTLSPIHHWMGDNPSYSQNDICFHPLYKSLLATCSDSGKTQFWDLRSELDPNQAIISTLCKNSLNCICFNTHSSYTFATGDDKGNVYLWDMRLSNKPLTELNGHKDSISRLQFNPTYSGLLGSSSQDGTMLIWDISKDSGGATENKELNNGCSVNNSALRFAHHGHTSGVNDFCWSNNEYEPTMVTSVGWDNRLCCWQMSEMALIED